MAKQNKTRHPGFYLVTPHTGRLYPALEHQATTRELNWAGTVKGRRDHTGTSHTAGLAGCGLWFQRVLCCMWKTYSVLLFHFGKWGAGTPIVFMIQSTESKVPQYILGYWIKTSPRRGVQFLKSFIRRGRERKKRKEKAKAEKHWMVECAHFTAE